MFHAPIAILHSQGLVSQALSLWLPPDTLLQNPTTLPADDGPREGLAHVSSLGQASEAKAWLPGALHAYNWIQGGTLVILSRAEVNCSFDRCAMSVI